ncbi:hypothetical protein [Hymenobacter profundi]|uniref:Lipoprotein n=1 Tax=Hymenobacter profundi TaxID=1982110 RepID=A0ABS6WW63_9BACT|nr:hypothetical protein [Hymenobacter profundi]MBW3127703.1 hypothetical protein [Hymenobacter profundi]
MKKIATLALAALLMGTGLLSSGCAHRSSLAKKTAAYKHRSKGKIPCPCESN